jgi:hypothetical protein
VWWHELVRDLIGGSLAVLNLYEKDDDFGSEDERSSSHSRTRKLRCGDWFLVHGHGPYL